MELFLPDLKLLLVTRIIEEEAGYVPNLFDHGTIPLLAQGPVYKLLLWRFQKRRLMNPRAPIRKTLGYH